MPDQKSSFYMGNEFNGFGDTTYLKGTQKRTYVPLSQENVHLTRDFSNLVLKALGCIPLILNLQALNSNLIVFAIGGMSILNQVVVTKDAATGAYIFKFRVAPNNGLTDGSYLQIASSQSGTIPSMDMIQPGWEEQADGRWKYINSKGKYVCGDWVEQNGARYYMNSSGIMLTGWQKIGRTKWYYFKSSIDENGRESGGQMVLGWRNIDGSWYYFDPTAGHMLTGWQTINGKKYYLKKENEAVKGNDYGYMKTGWQEIGNKWYYFSDDGDMAISKWIEENGERYWVGADGVWVEGTKKDKVIFVDGEENSVSGDDVWIQCETRGATDFYIKTSSSAQIRVYKDKMLSDKKLYDIAGTSLKKTFSDSAVNNNTNTYFIHAKADSKITVTCKVNTHTDSLSYAMGATWTAHDSSARYDTTIIKRMYYYVNKTWVSYMVTLVNDSSFLDFQSTLVNGTVGGALTLLGGFEGTLTQPVYKKLLGYATSAAGIFTAFKSPVDFKDLVLSEINEAAGYIEMEHGVPIYERGACLNEYIYNGLTFYDISPWEGSEMEGAKGYTGKWDKNKKIEED